MNINNNLDSNPLNIANVFNTYFTNIAGNLVKNLSRKGTTMNKNPLHYLHQNIKKQNSPIKLDYTTTHEINKIIHSLKCKDSYVYYEISTKIIQLSAAYILSPLTYTFNKILSTGTFPDRLKFSEVRPLFKNRSTMEFLNYRLSHCCLPFLKL